MRRRKSRGKRAFNAGFYRGSKATGKRAFRAGFNKAKRIGIRKLNHQRIRTSDPEEEDYVRSTGHYY